MVEMKEIKPNLLTRLKCFFLLHPVAVAIIAVIFAIMLFDGCENARAEGTDDYLSQIENTYFSDINSSNRSIIEGLISQYDMNYFFIGRSGGTAGDLSSRPSQAILLFLNADNIYIDRFLRCAPSPSYSGVRDTYYNDTSALYFAFNNAYNVNVWPNYSDNLFTGTVHGVAIWQDYHGSPWGIQFSMSFVNGISSNYSYSSIGSMNRGNTNYGNAFSVNNYISYGNYFAFSSVTSGGNCYYCHSSIDIAPSYSDDDRLKFAIIDNVSNGSTLMTDIRDFVADFPIHDTSHSSVYLYPESITLGYSVDGVSKTITLDSNNSSIRSKYIFETPLSAFDYSNTDDVVSITTCDFTVVGAAQGDPDLTSQSFKISCDYPLKQLADPIDKGNNQYSNDVNGDSTSPEVAQSLNYLVTFREGYGLDFDEFSDVVFPDYYTYADVYLYNNQAAYTYLMDNIFSVNSVAYIIQNIANDEDDVITQIGLFLDDSNYGQYYDVIVFDWIQENSSSITHTYYYFETVSGRNKATTQIVRVLQEDVNNIKVNSAAIFTAVDNLENESLEFFNAKLSFDEDILGWLRTIDYSINGINIPEPDYSDITSRLNYIMDKLSIIANHSSLPSEDDTVSEAIAYFKSHSLNDLPLQSVFDDNKLSIWMAGKVHSWLQGTDSQTTKISLLNDAFDTLTSLYDSLSNESGFFGNMEKYLLALRGGSIQDRDGLYFSRFFHNSFDPDSYDGGSL